MNNVWYFQIEGSGRKGESTAFGYVVNCFVQASEKEVALNLVSCSLKEDGLSIDKVVIEGLFKDFKWSNKKLFKVLGLLAAKASANAGKPFFDSFHVWDVHGKASIKM